MKFEIFMAAAIALTGVSALAQPVLYDQCANVKIRSVPRGAGAFLSKDCKTAFVLPPTVGEMRISGLTTTENLRRCEGLKSLSSIHNAQLKRLEKIAEALAAVDEEPANDGQTPIDDGSLFPKPKPKPKPQVPKKDHDFLAELGEVKSILADVQTMLKDYTMVEGSTGRVLLDSNHGELVNAYQQANPNLTFRQIPLADAQIHLSRRASVDKGELPAMLAPVSLPTGEAAQGAGIYGGALSGQIYLSMVGACPYYDVKGHRMKKTDVGSGELAENFNANVTYVYNLAINRSYWAKYNLSSMLRRLQSSESRGGLFSSKTINKLIVEKESGDWFMFRQNTQDPRFEFEDSLRQTVKAELVDRVFKQIGLLAMGTEGTPPLANPKPNGAAVGAENLRKCPNVYCQIGAAVLDVGNAIFGREEAVSEYIQKNNFWSEDNVEETRTFPFRGTTRFDRKDTIL